MRKYLYLMEMKAIIIVTDGIVCQVKLRVKIFNSNNERNINSSSNKQIRLHSDLTIQKRNKFDLISKKYSAKSIK